MRVLLTDASGLTSRQVASRLSALGHHVEALSSSTLCLTRFTRHVRAVHRVAPYGQDARAWFDAAMRLAADRQIDLIFPTQEQVVALSAFQAELRVPSVVPSFEALAKVQDKVSAFDTLTRVGIAQPPTFVARTSDDLRRASTFPVFVKQPIGTASATVRRADSQESLRSAALALGIDDRPPLLVQQAAVGPLAMVQLVARRGALIAWHACVRVREGAAGSACTKESLDSQAIHSLGETLVRALSWHGALSLDVILTPEGPQVIDVNPRLVEPQNAWFAGVDLVDAMLSLSHKTPHVQPAPVAGVRSHQLLLALLGAARRPSPRRAILAELASALRRTGPYATGREELTPIARDPIAALPVLAALSATMVHPAWAQWFEGGAVKHYALSPRAWEELRAATLDAR